MSFPKTTGICMSREITHSTPNTTIFSGTWVIHCLTIPYGVILSAIIKSHYEDFSGLDLTNKINMLAEKLSSDKDEIERLKIQSWVISGLKNIICL